MKALTVWQPWASLLIGGFKTYETRSWSTDHRGWIAIHAAKREPGWVRDMFSGLFVRPITRVFWTCLEKMGYDEYSDLPRGQIIGLIKIDGVFSTPEIRSRVTELDLAFGDWTDGRFAWRVCNIHPLQKPVTIRGSQRLWNWAAPRCDNCGAEIPEVSKTSWGQRICCPHCAFNPLGCRCKYGEFGVAETEWYCDPDMYYGDYDDAHDYT